jgi:membrane-associated phospholipid phosphatase
MHWLQTIDTAVFHFINGSLSNPFCDWLMPLISGGDGVMRWFVPLALALVLIAICFGNARVRLCAVMIVLVIALGDPLIVNTLKHLVARPRPCVALPDVIERLDCTASGSMPSAHAANWFAMTMVMFLFYRRSLWFMLPVALLVSFSRVYNGVHYPGDVLAGMILGAGYAVAGVVALQTIWNRVGRRWFPVWHAGMPLLLKAEGRRQKAEPDVQSSAKPSTINHQLPTADSHWLRLGHVLIFVMLIANWVYVASGTLQLSQDEACQWVGSKHLALSYYSQPPGSALIQFAGTSLFGDTEFGIRFFAPLFAAILSVLVMRFLARELGARPAFWLLLIVMVTPLLVPVTILMTMDSPLVLCWTWAFVAGWRAVQPDGQTRHWLMVGLAMGLGFLCNYAAVFQIGCWVIFFALAPRARVHLRRSGPWLAGLIFLLGTVPVLIWNCRHGWSTLAAVMGGAGLHSPWQPTLHYFWDFTCSEALWLNPVFFVGSWWALFGFWKWRREWPIWLYCFCMGAPVFLGYGFYSFHSPILPSWIAVAVVPMFCLMVAYWEERRRFIRPFLTLGLVLGCFVFAFLHQGRLVGKIFGEMLPPAKDPACRVLAWKPEAAFVEAEREKLQATGKPAFIICSDHGMAGLYSFYIPGAKAAIKSEEPLVYAMVSDQPHTEFYFWPEYNYREHRQGENAIFVSEMDPYPLERDWFWKWLTHEPIAYASIPPLPPAPVELVQQFESVTDLGGHDITVDGRVFHQVRLWACHHLK